MSHDQATIQNGNDKVAELPGFGPTKEETVVSLVFKSGDPVICIFAQFSFLRTLLCHRPNRFIMTNFQISSSCNSLQVQLIIKKLKS